MYMTHLYDETDPFPLFSRWFAEAKTHPAITEPTAMSLATMGEHAPSVRIVLLKDYNAHGFVFYTNLHSRKSQEIRQHLAAALCFYWMPLDKQVRLVGTMEQVEDPIADAYFASRGREKQLGAWASLQSQPMPDRDALQQRIAEMEQRFAGQDVPRPPHWSGWRLIPQEMEFWEQKDYRLHHRIRFSRKSPQDSWQKELLFP